MGFIIILLSVVVAVCATCAAAVAAYVLAFSVSSTKYKKQLHGVTARYEAALRTTDGGGGCAGGRDGVGTVAAMYESFTLGWLNLLVQHLWLPVLEKLVSTIAAEKLQIILNEVVRKNSGKTAWKFVESIAVEEVTFGLAPPQFQFCTAKYDPSRSYLLLTMNLHYHSSGFQAVLTPRMRFANMKPISVRLEIMQLHLSGKLHLGLYLTKEPPGIKGIDYSFASPPEFDIQASPVGYLNLHGELPGLIRHLRSHLQRIINRRIVEPHRRYLDLQRIYRNKHVQRVGGPGGCLRVCVIGGRNLMRVQAVGSTSTAAAPPPTSTAGSTADCDSYVELRFGREVFRTPIAHHTADPVFNWQFDIRLPADLAPPPAPASDAAADGADGGADTGSSRGGGVILQFRVLNARTIGEPEVLSRSVLDVNGLGLMANGEPRAKLVELAAANGGGPRGTLSLQVSWLKALPKKASPFPQDAARAAAATTSAATAAAAAAVTAAAAAAASPVAAFTTPVMIPRARPPSAAPYNSSAASTPVHVTPANSLQRPMPAFGTDSSAAAVATASRRRSEQAAAGAADVVMAHLQDVAGSAPMVTDGCGGGRGGSGSFGPYGAQPQEASGASGSYNRTAAAAAAIAARGGPARNSVDSGVSHSLGFELTLAEAGPVEASSVVRHIHVITNDGDAAATPRDSTDMATDGSASGATSSSPSVVTPPQKPGGAGAVSTGGRGVGSSGKMPPLPPGRPRRGMGILLALGGWRSGSVAAAAAGADRRADYAVGGGEQEASSTEVTAAGAAAALATAGNAAVGGAAVFSPSRRASLSLLDAAMAAAAEAAAANTPGASMGSSTTRSPRGNGGAAEALQTPLPKLGVPVGPGIPSGYDTDDPPYSGTSIYSPLMSPGCDPKAAGNACGRAECRSPVTGPMIAAAVAAMNRDGPAASLHGRTSEGALPATPPQPPPPRGAEAPSGTHDWRTEGREGSNRLLLPVAASAGPETTAAVASPVYGDVSVRPSPNLAPYNFASRSPAPTDGRAADTRPASGSVSVGFTGLPSANHGSLAATLIGHTALATGPAASGDVLTAAGAALAGPGGGGGSSSWQVQEYVPQQLPLPAGSAGGAGAQWPASLTSLAQVIRMQRLLQSERQEKAELWEMLSEMSRKYKAMVRLRRSENERALIEGARFSVHLGRDVRRVVVWYNEPRGVLQVDPDTGASDRGADKGGGTDPWPRCFSPQELERADRGPAAFPNPSAWAGVMAAIMGRTRPPPPTSLEPLKCFSLFLEGGRSLHLQLPATGNGRSRDEWVDALQDLAMRATLASRGERNSTPKASTVIGAASVQVNAVGAASVQINTASAAAGIGAAGVAVYCPVRASEGGAQPDGRVAG